MSRKPFIHLIIAAVIVVAALGASAFVDYRLLARIADREALEADIAARRVAQGRNVNAAQTLRESAATRAAVRGYFVPASDTVSFLEGLESLARSFGASATVVSIANATDPRPALVIPLEITGSYTAVMRTLGALEYGPHDIRVTSFSLGNSAGDEKGAWTAAVGLTVGAIATSTTP